MLVNPDLFLFELLDGFVEVAAREFSSLACLSLAALKFQTPLFLGVLLLLDAVAFDFRLLLDVFQLADLVLDP